MGYTDKIAKISENIKKKMRNNALKATVLATLLAPCSGIAQTVAPNGTNKPQTEVFKNNLNIDSSLDQGLSRNIFVNSLTKNGKKTRRLYSIDDIAKKYNLGDDFFNGKYTKDKGITLKSIIEYEATRPEAVSEALFFNDLSGNLTKNVNKDKEVQNAENTKGHYDFNAIYQKNSKDIKLKNNNDKMKELYETLSNTPPNIGASEITDAIDNQVIGGSKLGLLTVNILHTFNTLPNRGR